MDENNKMMTLNDHLASKKKETKKSSKKHSDQCKEYNTLKYKTMIMTGNNIDINIENETDSDKLNNFLEDDIKRNKKEIWSKLTKTEKMRKIMYYMRDEMRERYALSENEIVDAKKYISTLIDRKKLNKNNDVDYDKQSGRIISIDIITFNEVTRKFSINKQFTPKNNSKKSYAKDKTKTVKNNVESSSHNEE